MAHKGKVHETERIKTELGSDGAATEGAAEETGPAEYIEEKQRATGPATEALRRANTGRLVENDGELGK